MENAGVVLVTGGSGFLSGHIILQLLQKGYSVRTTLRSLEKKGKVLKMLRENGIESPENKISFVETELTDDTNWDEAMKDCKYVLSVASPVFFEALEDEKEAIRPAVEGILRILKFARDAGVQRVVMTSSFGALGFSHTDKKTETTEEDWTDPDQKGLSVYEKSKCLAERAAWEFIEREGGSLEFTVINPVAILGPALGRHTSRSFDFLKHLLDGSMTVVPAIPLNIVDVRDVADIHIRAMESPEANGERFIASADGEISMHEIAAFLKAEHPEATAKVSTKKIPNWILYLASPFNDRAKSAVMYLNVNRRVSNEKARTVLNWKPLATQEEAILASLNSILKYNVV
jgi:nucleoside-diphosphate-sugar epimerase